VHLGRKDLFSLIAGGRILAWVGYDTSSLHRSERGQKTLSPAMVPQSLCHPPSDDDISSRTLKLTQSLRSYSRFFEQENTQMRALHRLRLLCGAAVNHPRVQLSIIFLIVINSVIMGVSTFDFVTENPTVTAAFNNTDLGFLVVFTIELMMQFIYRGYSLFKDGWLVFDFVIILVSWA
jgi:hypothetical protein